MQLKLCLIKVNFEDSIINHNVKKNNNCLKTLFLFHENLCCLVRNSTANKQIETQN